MMSRDINSRREEHPETDTKVEERLSSQEDEKLNEEEDIDAEGPEPPPRGESKNNLRQMVFR